MRFGSADDFRRNLLRGAAIVALAGLAAGCSSDVMRFDKSLMTSSTGQPPQPVAQQPYPGDYAGVDNTATGSVPSRSGGIFGRMARGPVPASEVGQGQMMASAAPVYQDNSGQNAYPQQAFPASPSAGTGVARGALAPVAGAPVDQATYGTAPSAPAPVATAAAPAAPGWGDSGGTRVTIQPGETVYNLSRRYGVPADAIMRANGLNDASRLAAGQQLVIPTYNYASGAPVSAPDANPEVARATPSTGLAQPSAPAPQQQGEPERLAVLPQQPGVQASGGEATASASPQGGQAGTGGGYTVVAGDTLNGIARKTGVSADAIRQANGLSSGLIRIGQTLVIPGNGSATTQVAAAPARVDPVVTASAGEQPKPEVAAYTPPAKPATVESAVQTAAVAPDSTGIERMRWPVRGRVVTPFGGSSGGKRNDGIDIAVPSGTPIKAAENGVVIFAGDGLKDFGNTVLVRHDNGLVTVYGHASELKVARGDKVRRGQDIALSGMTGAAETPKLHFEVRKDSTPVNPATYLE